MSQHWFKSQKLVKVYYLHAWSVENEVSSFVRSQQLEYVSLSFCEMIRQKLLAS